MRRSALFVLGAIILALGLILVPISPAVEGAPGDELTVYGTNIQIGGEDIDGPLFGCCDTTVLQFAIMAWINGETTYAGDNQIFPNFGGTIPCSNASQLWGKYFTLAEYYGLDLVRIGAGDKWGTDLQYDAWTQHHDQYIALLETMARYSDAHGVKVILVLAGTQDYPAPYFGAADNSFTTTSTAYANYIAYARDTMSHMADEPGIAIIDVWNEPDHNLAWSKYWSSNGGKAAYHSWACDIANKTLAYNWHPRLIGVAGLGDMFSWGQEEFNLATDVGFELNDRHYYASAEDEYLFADPEAWSDATGRPLVWTELGNNANYPEERWPYAEQQIAAAGGQAFVAMTMLGTANYPYTGEIVDNTTFPGDPEDPPVEDPEDPPADPDDTTDPDDDPDPITPPKKYSWASLSSGKQAVSSPRSSAFLFVIPALGAALVLGSLVGPKPKKSRRARRGRR